MTELHSSNKIERPRCLCCHKKFTPDVHVGKRQKYCSDKKCQAERQRLNEKNWVKNADNQKFLKAKQKRWLKKNPDYLKEWREKHPESVRRNQEFMREYQRRKRDDRMFDKTKELTSQISKNKGVVYTSRGKTWILMHLKRPLSWAKDQSMMYASKQLSKIRVPQGRLYDLSNVFG